MEQSTSLWEKLNTDIRLGPVLNDKAKEYFYSEFASLLDAGMDIKRSLDILIEEQDKKAKKEAFLFIKESIVKGDNLSEAMRKSGNFSPYEYQSIRIGEEAGKLKIVLHQLGKYFEEKVKLRKQMVSVFTYPAFVLMITFGVLYFMLSTVVPMFQEVFQQFGKELPWLTQKIIAFSENFSYILLVVFGVIVTIVLLHVTQRKEVWYRDLTGKLLLNAPIFGKLFRKIYLARFAQSMSLLMVSRTPLVKSLDLVSEMIGFYPIEVALTNARKEILRGNSLHAGLSNFPIFDRRFISLVKIAEEINQLDTTFERVTIQLNSDIEYQTKLIGTLIEPIIIILIGGIVGVIMIAMYLPMFNLSEVIQ